MVKINGIEVTKTEFREYLLMNRAKKKARKSAKKGKVKWMNVYKKVSIELTKEEKNTLVLAHSLLESLYLNDDSQEVIDKQFDSMHITLERLVGAFENLMEYFSS